MSADSAVLGWNTAEEPSERAMIEVPLLIGNRERPASDKKTFDRHNPISGELVSRAAAATVDDAKSAVEAADTAFPVWSALGPTERRTKLLQAADLLEKRAPEFSVLMMAELGATAGWGIFNVHFAAQMLREAAALTTQIKGEVIPSDVPGNLAMAVRQPVGVVLCMAPWNAPVILGVRAIAAPLACGNTVVFKASEMCPATHQLIFSVMREAGLHDGVVNVVTHAPEDAAAIVEAMISHPAVTRINFTGSTRVGKIIAQLAAKYLKPVVLELGGKAAMLILDDADLDEAVNAAVFGAFANQGQVCMSTERILVDEKIADAFVRKFIPKVRALPCGDPRKGEVVLGSVVDSSTVERLRRLIDDAASHGAKLLLGGGHGEGTIVPAVVLDFVTPEMQIFREESFAPSVSITRIKSDKEAVRLANDTEYGLSAAVFSRDTPRALNVARQIRSGICHINSSTVHDEAQMPFGGVKGSGYGRFGGDAAIHEFTELRWITIQTEPRHYPF
jgi:acyl-CoA reductase-like NAD-dependent aldehyde dehydrogenase